MVLLAGRRTSPSSRRTRSSLILRAPQWGFSLLRRTIRLSIGWGTEQWWADVLARDPEEREEDEVPATADAEGLRRFIESEVLPWFESRKEDLANRPLVREQAFGEALDVDKRAVDGPANARLYCDARF